MVDITVFIQYCFRSLADEIYSAFFPLNAMSPILKTLRRALASSICAIFLSSVVSPTTSVAANNANLPSPKEMVVPANKPKTIALLEAKQVILLYSLEDCYNVGAVGGYIRYCEGRSPQYIPYVENGSGGGVSSGGGPTPIPGGNGPFPNPPNGPTNPTPSPCDPNRQDCPDYIPPTEQF